jgi:NADPH:quinone reductase-like Zn-dependent oxidoreductase
MAESRLSWPIVTIFSNHASARSENISQLIFLSRDQLAPEPMERIQKKGKTVVITGGTSGIGEIAAERLAQMGARIVLIARSKSRGKVTLARLHVGTKKQAFRSNKKLVKMRRSETP